MLGCEVMATWGDAKGKAGVSELAKSYDHSSGWNFFSQSVEKYIPSSGIACVLIANIIGPRHTGENT
ncbi:MAG: hypothetical protein JWM99_2966 [Verrucomicrobiales bacterium]|nr:hypothetical protein [Verrucomicrobiales bacterium]